MNAGIRVLKEKELRGHILDSRPNNSPNNQSNASSTNSTENAATSNSHPTATSDPTSDSLCSLAFELQPSAFGLSTINQQPLSNLADHLAFVDATVSGDGEQIGEADEFMARWQGISFCQKATGPIPAIGSKHAGTGIQTNGTKRSLRGMSRRLSSSLIGLTPSSRYGRNGTIEVLMNLKRMPTPQECVAFDPLEFRLTLEVSYEATKAPSSFCPDNSGPGSELLRLAIATGQRYRNDHLKRWSFRFRCWALEAIWDSRGFIKHFPHTDLTWAAAAEVAASFPLSKSRRFESRSFLKAVSRKLQAVNQPR